MGVGVSSECGPHRILRNRVRTQLCDVFGSLREKGSDRGLIVQVIEFRTVTYPSLMLDMLQLVAEEPQIQAPDLAALNPDGLSEMSNLKLAIAKIRKVVKWSKQMVAA